MRVALLRGINVGGHRKVPMADLRRALAGAGLGAAATHGASGNVVFEGGPADEAEAAAAVVAAVHAAVGFDVPVAVRTIEELRAAVDAHPFDPPELGDKMLHILFCDEAPDAAAVARLDPTHAPDDHWSVIGREIHVRYGKGAGRSKATLDWFERRLEVTATARNLPSLGKTLELADRLNPGT